MEKRNFKNMIKELITSSIFISFIVFLLAAFVVYRLTISKVDSAYDKEFIRDIIVEAHGMLFDILVIGTFIFALRSLVEKKREKNRDIQRWKEEIDDYREWRSDEAAHRIAGIVRRLNKQNVTEIDLHSCFLKRAVLHETNLEGANLSSADLERATLQLANLKGAQLSGANLRTAWMEASNLEGADLEGANLQVANLMVANLQGAYLKEANLEGAGLRWAKGLTIEQFSEVKTLYGVSGLDPKLKKQIKEKYPHLLKKPKKEGEKTEANRDQRHKEPRSPDYRKRQLSELAPHKGDEG